MANPATNSYTITASMSERFASIEDLKKDVQTLEQYENKESLNQSEFQKGIEKNFKYMIGMNRLYNSSPNDDEYAFSTRFTFSNVEYRVESDVDPGILKIIYIGTLPSVIDIKRYQLTATYDLNTKEITYATKEIDLETEAFADYIKG